MAQLSPPQPSDPLPRSNRPRLTRMVGPSKHDEIVNDILKHLTTLNTGLLAILSAFSDQIKNLLVVDKTYGIYFLYAFYISLLFCMIGFMLTIISLQQKNPNRRRNIKFLRDVIILFAALGYISALMVLVTLYSSSFGLF